MADHYIIHQQLDALQTVLDEIVHKDQEQEVQGIAVPVLDAVIAEAKAFVGEDDPVISSVADVISPESVERGEPIRAVDALLVVTVLLKRIGHPPIRVNVNNPFS